MNTDCDVAIIGAGPAGLTAALALGTAGLSTVLIDEQPELGGQFYRRSAHERDHRPAGARLIAAVHRAGVECRPGTSVWGVADDQRTLLLAPADGNGLADTVAAQFVIVATGAYERVAPFAGWELPGVTTVGFAQHLAADGTAVGQRVLLAGSGPFLLPVACSLLARGATVIGIAEAGSPYRPTRAALGALAHPGRLAELARYSTVLARHRVPIWQDHVVLRAEADSAGRHVGRVTLARTGAPTIATTEVRVDALCVGIGFRPQLELVRLLGCRIRADARSGDLFPVTDEYGRSSRPDVFVAGETAGIGGAGLAMAEGEIAAAKILADLGHAAGKARPSAAGKARRRRARGRRFAALTAQLYPGADELTRSMLAGLPDEVHVCRCEAVSAGAVRAAAAVAGQDPSAVKGTTRIGMGPCQGRECSASLRALIGAEPDASATPQMPIRPVLLSSLIAGDAEAGQ
jgi:NADPH-dependent 2,4-dienoyl-CoA reductase/sulfur reductase-like enzyme